MIDSRKDSEQIYAEWRRQAPRYLLDAYEQRTRDAEEAWDLRNEATADRLDALVGKVLASRESVTLGTRDGETNHRRVRPAGTLWRVRWRVRDTFIVALATDSTLLAVFAADGLGEVVK